MPELATESDHPTHIIGIGASAGGLEALKSLFASMPDNLGIGFVVVQHLSPDFKSVMDELLAKGTSMTVTFAEEGEAIKANHVYLNSPQHNLLIGDGKFITLRKIKDKEPRMPIDTFFRSLAEDQQERGVALVLSGTGSDGSRGIRAIKEVGGFVMCQNPSDAKFDGMPRSSMNSGFVDFVGTASELSAKLSDYIVHPLNQPLRRPEQVDEDQDEKAALRSIFEILKEYTEIDFSEYKQSTVSRRLERRMAINQLNTVSDYHALILSSPNELNILSKDLLIGVTEFFRDPEMYDRLRTNVIPSLIRATGSNDAIRIWVAACSTGEEAYSLAILFDQVMAEIGQRRVIKIFATDVDADAIASAGGGAYPSQVVESLDKLKLDEYFTAEGDQYVIKPFIRKMIIFAVHNLIKDPPFSNIHLVSCRNMLIYLQQSVQRRVLSALQFSMVKGGYLVLGSSESNGEIQASYETIDERHRIYKKIDHIRLPLPSIGHESATAEKVLSPKAPSVSLLLKSHRGRDRDIVYRPVVNRLFELYVPPSIVVDDNLNVVHIYGNVEDHTRKHPSGEFSAHISNLLSEETSVAVITAIHSAFEKKSDVMYEKVVIQRRSKVGAVDIHVSYVDSDIISDRHAIVSFIDSEEQKSDTPIEVIPFEEINQNKQRIIDLERQLQRKQEHLQVTIEELETTNEELQASNEELMAANEELQSTNEELQSVNEELYTVNHEFQQKIEEISQVNLDLDNLIHSSKIGIIFLDSHLMIRNFTPTAEKYINVLQSDIGRPFHHISHKLSYDNLLDDISKVIQNQQPRRRETLSADGTDLLITLNPYLDKEGAVKGCVLALTDISEVKELRKGLSNTRNTLRSLFSSDAVTSGNSSIELLVFDDDEGEIELITRQLKQVVDQNYTIHTATNADDALDILNTHSIDLCFIDYSLGAIQATEFISNLPHRLRDDVAFILITNYLDEKVDSAAFNEGIINSISKDELTPSLLKYITRSVVRSHQAIKQLASWENTNVEDA